jgi:hypothetical protein
MFRVELETADTKYESDLVVDVSFEQSEDGVVVHVTQELVDERTTKPYRMSWNLKDLTDFDIYEDGSVLLGTVMSREEYEDTLK